MHFKTKNDKAICQWGKNLSFYIDKLVLEGKYYTHIDMQQNLTAKVMHPLSYYLTIEEMFRFLMLQYPELSNEQAFTMLN